MDQPNRILPGSECEMGSYRVRRKAREKCSRRGTGQFLFLFLTLSLPPPRCREGSGKERIESRQLTCSFPTFSSSRWGERERLPAKEAKVIKAEDYSGGVGDNSYPHAPTLPFPHSPIHSSIHPPVHSPIPYATFPCDAASWHTRGKRMLFSRWMCWCRSRSRFCRAVKRPAKVAQASSGSA